MRLLHLRLAGTDVNARFVIDERSDWEGFIAGCTERLRVDGVARVTDTGGENILTVRDLIHDDYVVVHATSHAHGHAAVAAAAALAADASPTEPGAAAAASAADAEADGASTAAATATTTATATATATAAAVPAAAVPDPAAAAAAAANAAAAAAAAAVVAAAAAAAVEAKAKEEEEARLACPPRHPKYRVAMLVPLLGPVPGFLPYFIASAARASPLADFLIFHERTSMPGGTGTNTALTTHHPPRTTHHAQRITHHAPRTAHHASPCTMHPRWLLRQPTRRSPTITMSLSLSPGLSLSLRSSLRPRSSLRLRPRRGPGLGVWFSTVFTVMRCFETRGAAPGPRSCGRPFYLPRGPEPAPAPEPEPEPEVEPKAETGAGRGCLVFYCAYCSEML